jgi:hypothetical protein
LNKLAIRRLRRKGGTFMGKDVLLLTTIGLKSGLERTTPVGWFAGKDGSWLIVASAGGAAAGGARGLAADHRRRAPFVQYQHKTDRELPVIRLVPRSG